MEIKQQLAISLQLLVKSLTGLEIEPQVQASSDLSKGDFTTNVAMTIYGKVNSEKLKVKSPIEFAHEIVKNLKLITNNLELFDRIEVAPPGFINFWLSREEISRQVEEVLRSSEKIDGAVKPELPELIVEFGDLNPFKEPHIGHLRIFSVGEAIARLNEAGGTKLIRASYQGDVGLHVAKAIYGIKNHESFGSAQDKSGIKNLDEGDLEKQAKYLGKCYADGAKAYEENPEAKKEIDEINIKIYQKDPQVIKIWKKGRKISLDYFEILYKSLDVKYDNYYFESETAPVGLGIVKKHVGKVFEKDDGAIIFRGEKYGLHTRVFVTSSGNPMYEAKDLALAFLKNKDYPNADSMIITANEQTEYFKVLLKALGEVDEKIANKTQHLAVGFVNLKEGKMSSRTGNVVSAFWLLEETRKRLKNGFKEVSDEVLEDLSVGAVKWSMLKFSRDSNISFSIEESIQIEGNSGPYMQYAYARTQSILAKKPNASFEANSVKNLEGQELALARLICQFENVVLDAKNSFSPNILTNYLFDLAKSFSYFYETEKVIGGEREMERLVLTKVTGNVLKKGLYLLGIETPPKI